MLPTNATVSSNMSPIGPSVPRKLQEHLALCATSPERVMFLDIETTGLSHYYDEITIIGWSLDGKARTVVKGQDIAIFASDLAKANVLVTFNGIRFDARFIAQEFPDLALPPVHIDLMYLCRRVGLTGGQKSIEAELRLHLRDDLADVDGFAAVLLWHRYLRGDLEALSLLIRYNRADVAAMGALLDTVIGRLAYQPDLYIEPVSFVRWSAPIGWKEVADELLVPPAPTLRQAQTFSSLFGGTPAETARIVGIDLTGSETKPSGWAILDGNNAETALLATDEEIIERTLAEIPHLVSIDSPLCMPAGRMSADDTDPGRDEFGIMRQCERELKRRGVNVYPCLLPSMQNLTVRGMSLADRFRKLGTPVIESYPGAAQDIMRIPRKGAGKEWLGLGLREFGITGAYTVAEVSHDELDAITSALVGTFHWIGLSEPLGSAEEPPLVIPKLDGSNTSIVVGVSGPIAAGKTTFAINLAENGFAYTRFSLVIDDELGKLGQTLTRANRQILGEEIHRTGKQRWLAEQALARVSDAPMIVVDGLRFPEDHAFFVECSGVNYHHIHIDASVKLRSERYSVREADLPFCTAVEAEVEQQVHLLRELAHRVVKNESTLNGLAAQAADLAQDIKGEKSCQSQS